MNILNNILEKKTIERLSLIISTQKLFDLILNNQKNIRIVDTRSFNEYLNGHIPGAINIELMQYHWNDTSKQGIKGFNRQMRHLFSNIGINGKTFVIFYDNINWLTDSGQSPYLILDTQEIKTTWHPIENIGGAKAGY